MSPECTKLHHFSKKFLEEHAPNPLDFSHPVWQHTKCLGQQPRKYPHDQSCIRPWIPPIRYIYKSLYLWHTTIWIQRLAIEYQDLEDIRMNTHIYAFRSAFCSSVHISCEHSRARSKAHCRIIFCHPTYLPLGNISVFNTPLDIIIKSRLSIIRTEFYARHVIQFIQLMLTLMSR